MRIYSVALLFFLVTISWAQTSSWTVAQPKVFANTIQAEDLKRHLYILASKEMEGRETGQPGQKRAAEYIAGVFKQLGLPTVGEAKTYFQRMIYRTESWEQINFVVNGEKAKTVRDFYAIPYYNTDLDSGSVREVIFLGYGIDDPRYSDYADVEVRNKVILIYDGEPKDKDEKSLLTGTDSLSDWSLNWRRKLQVAKAKGVKLVLFIDSNFQENLLKNAQQNLAGYEVQFKDVDTTLANNIFLSSTLARKIVGKELKKVVKARERISRRAQPENESIRCDLSFVLKKKVRLLSGENVLGYIEGIDEQLRHELVIVTSHYDHLGKRGDSVFFGADDNASGSATVLEIARAFVEAQKAGQGPRRSVLVMLVSGEEKGLLGSKYYVENPVFPLEHTVANVNVDMVGRVDEKHSGNPDYIYVIGADRLSSELHQINETANATYTRLELDYTYNEESDPNRYYYRSDHYNFAEKGIPAIFYFSGTHQDYHRPSDTPDKINLAKMEKIGQLVFHTVWELANREERIKVDKR